MPSLNLPILGDGNGLRVAQEKHPLPPGASVRLYSGQLIKSLFRREWLRIRIESACRDDALGEHRVPLQHVSELGVRIDSLLVPPGFPEAASPRMFYRRSCGEGRERTHHHADECRELLNKSSQRRLHSSIIPRWPRATLL